MIFICAVVLLLGTGGFWALAQPEPSQVEWPEDNSASPDYHADRNDPQPPTDIPKWKQIISNIINPAPRIQEKENIPDFALDEPHPYLNPYKDLTESLLDNLS
ncbi:MAG: hypothetical protein GF333_01680 [Candidatus Omnitrophica bacterium]|nr:hypothetical protein [Candidatus Omnitrophota bacterium]